MRFFLPAAAFASIGMLVFQASASGQMNAMGSSGTMSGLGGSTGMGTSSGTFGSRTLGGSLSAGSRSFTGGAGGMGGMGGGAGGMGSTGGIPGAMSSTVGSTTNATQFMNNARSSGFVGADSRNYANVLGGVMSSQSGTNRTGQYGTMGMGGTNTLGRTGTLSGMNTLGGMNSLGGGMNSLGGLNRNTGLRSQTGGFRTGMNQFGMGGRTGLGMGGMGGMYGGLGGNGMASRDIPTAMRVAFPHRQPQAAAVSANVSQRLAQAQTRSLRASSPVTVSMQGSTATLRGTVATDHDRVIAEKLARLEPGVWQVKNEIAVSPATSAASTDSAVAPAPDAP